MMPIPVKVRCQLTNYYYLCIIPQTENSEKWRTSEFDQTAFEKTPSFPFRVGAKWKPRSWRTLESDQSTSEFDQHASEKKSEVFISEFSVLGRVQNGKLGVEKPWKNILRGFRVFRELPVFDLTIDLGY